MIFDPCVRPTAGDDPRRPEHYIQDDRFDYAQDDNGNLDTRTDRATLDVTSYIYDAQGQLIRIAFPDTTFATYAYDALGRRIAKDVDDCAGGREVTAYVYDGADILMEFDGAGGFLARYAHGDRVDQSLAMSRAGQDYYVQADHQGSVIRVTDAAGAVVNSYEYDAYGQRLAAVEGVEIAYGYTGREYDAESGLMYYRARVYDPAMGRFLQTDPLGFGAGDLNLYRYVGNDPVNRKDPSGLQSTCNTGCDGGEPSLEPGDRSYLMLLGESYRGADIVDLLNQYNNVISAAALDHGIDPGIVKAIIFEEQAHLQPGESTREEHGIGNTVGLGQITVGKHGFTREQLLDPETNIDAIATHLEFLQGQPLIDQCAPIASLATNYNCGKCTSITPYGRRVVFFSSRMGAGQK